MKGVVFVRVSPSPYQIPYRALIPKKGRADNLIVSVCVSASHVAMASIRMESAYVVMGEAAGIAASHAVKSGTNAHDVDIDAVRADMKKAGVITEWDGTGYGPFSKSHWGKGKGSGYWTKHPEDYKKIPIRLDPSWTKSGETRGSSTAGRSWESREAWNRTKKGYEWLFDAIDLNRDGELSAGEYQTFQDYKRADRNWATTLKARPLADILRKE